MSMTVIEHIEVGSGGAASIVLDEIPQTYTDLYLVVNARSTRSDVTYYTNGKIGINGLTSGYSNIELIGNAGTVQSRTDDTDGLWSWKFPSAVTTANTFGNAGFYFPNYTSSSAKSVSGDTVSEYNGTASFAWYLQLLAGLNSTTSPITSIEIGIRTADSANFVQYSSATLYGITAGSDGTTTVS